jgi:hypothetical protein
VDRRTCRLPIRSERGQRQRRRCRYVASFWAIIGAPQGGPRSGRWESRSVGRYLEPPVGNALFVDKDLAPVVDVPRDGGNVESVDVTVTVVVASVDAAWSIEGSVVGPFEQEAVLLSGGVEVAAPRSGRGC